MLVRTALLLCAGFGLAFPLPGAPANACEGNLTVASVQLRAQPAGSSVTAPLQWVNNLPAGCKLLYQPGELPAEIRKEAKVAWIVAPAARGNQDPGSLTVLEPRLASAPGEWTAPFPVGLVAFALGVQGLDEKRITSLMTREADLVGQLASYADQIEEMEQTVRLLAALEQEEEAEAGEAAPPGSASEQALLTLVRALNPAVAAYNPMVGTRLVGPTSRLGKASTMFFDNAGGFVPGGDVLPSVRGWLFPDSEFRSVYAQWRGTDTMTLCAQRLPRSKTRIVYLWARRIPNLPAPAVSLPQPLYAPAGARARLPLSLKPASAWQMLDRVRGWNLQSPGGGDPIPVELRQLGPRTVELDLRKGPLKPGVYRLAGRWDWESLPVAGDLHVAPLGELKGARLAAESRELLVAGAGPTTVTLEGADFQFVESVSLRPAGRRTSRTTNLDFQAPGGFRRGPQNSLWIDVDTASLRPGEYLLAFTQTGGGTQEAAVRVLPEPPRIEDLPLRLNTGVKEQALVLRGSGLERIESAECEKARCQLGPVRTGREGRQLTAILSDGVAPGTRLSLSLKLAGAAEPLRLPEALWVVGPRPRLASATAAAVENPPVALRPGEIPAGSSAGLTLKVENLRLPAAVRLACIEKEQTFAPLELRAGEKRGAAKLESLGEGALFLQFDPGAVGPPGCSLAAVVDSKETGASEPYPLGKVVRLPRIESFSLSDQKAGEALYAGELKGRDLEGIEKVGWSPQAGVPVPAPPAPLAGESGQQALKISLPWPPPAPRAPLFVWLRGDAEARPTQTRY